MPRGDGSGPMGAGPMTGRAAGFCAGYATPGFANPVGGGMGRGRGLGVRGGGRGGFGFRNRFYATGMPGRAVVAPPALTPEQEQTYLDNEINALEEELKAARERQGELSKKK